MQEEGRYRSCTMMPGGWVVVCNGKYFPTVCCLLQGIPKHSDLRPHQRLDQWSNGSLLHICDWLGE
ncbi:hypothetical protein NC653_037150 [Populus alba x Populus x berolinensis]|uniref:Uncharacterized protein n=1 Tax=Populus alba x Populus x berolinensis TaxID=444605 RepID=A0AAD6LLL0_9ROSI|nr:hypothetical protein NC653_037150 [Populus alba x Populus x berolinensis]